MSSGSKTPSLSWVSLHAQYSGGHFREREREKILENIGEKILDEYFQMDGSHSPGVRSHYCRAWRHTCPRPYFHACRLLHAPYTHVPPRDTPLYIPVSMFSCNPPPLCTGTHAHIHFRASFPRPISSSFGWCLPLLSFPLREGLSGHSLKSPFSSLFSLATLQPGGPRAVTSSS